MKLLCACFELILARKPRYWEWKQIPVNTIVPAYAMVVLRRNVVLHSWAMLQLQWVNLVLGCLHVLSSPRAQVGEVTFSDGEKHVLVGRAPPSWDGSMLLNP